METYTFENLRPGQTIEVGVSAYISLNDMDKNAFVSSRSREVESTTSRLRGGESFLFILSKFEHLVEINKIHINSSKRHLLVATTVIACVRFPYLKL